MSQPHPLRPDEPPRLDEPPPSGGVVDPLPSPASCCFARACTRSLSASAFSPSAALSASGCALSAAAFSASAALSVSARALSAAAFSASAALSASARALSAAVFSASAALSASAVACCSWYSRANASQSTGGLGGLGSGAGRPRVAAPRKETGAGARRAEVRVVPGPLAMRAARPSSARRFHIDALGLHLAAPVADPADRSVHDADRVAASPVLQKVLAAELQASRRLIASRT